MVAVSFSKNVLSVKSLLIKATAQSIKNLISLFVMIVGAQMKKKKPSKSFAKVWRKALFVGVFKNVKAQIVRSGL